MDTNGNQPFFENDAARAAFFQDRVRAVEVAKKEGDAASAEFLAKELELHMRTEALITQFPSEHAPSTESSIIPIDPFTDTNAYIAESARLAVRLIQNKVLDKNGNVIQYYASTIEYLEMHTGKQQKHVGYIHGFNYKAYGHNTRPGVGAHKSIESVNGYEIQRMYEKNLAELESLLLEKAN